MNTIRLLPVLGCLALVPTVALGAGFTIEGDDNKTVKIVFDSSGVDRSTAKGTALGLLDVLAKSEEDVDLELKLLEAKANSTSKLLAPLMTPEGKQALFARSDKWLKDTRAQLAKKTRSQQYQVKLGAKQEADGKVSFPYTLKFTSRLPCWRCKGKRGNNKCRSCRGVGVREFGKQRTGTITLVKQGQVWLALAVNTKCKRCKGTGKRVTRKKHDCSGEDCQVCAPRRCGTCRGKGKVQEGFLRSGRRYEKGKVVVAAGIPDLSDPGKAFASFAHAAWISKCEEKLSRNRLQEGFHTFQAFFMVKESISKPRTGPLKVAKYKQLKLETKSDTEASVTWSFAGGYSRYPKKVAGKAELKKGTDGKWRVHSVSRACWSCARRRLKDPKTECKRCKSTGFQPSKSLP